MTILESDKDNGVLDTSLAQSFYAKYEVLDILGSGASSTVRRCVEKKTKEEFAVKIIDLNSGVDLPDVIRSECMREVSILRRVAGHPNIIGLHDVFEGDAYIFLVFEVCRGGELFDYLTHKVTVSEKRTRIFMRQLFDAVDFIHKRRIVHRDLKPENILLDSRENIKLTDFGLAVFTEDNEELRETRGTPGYLAPEVLMVGYYEDQPPYGQPVDMWACGVIMYTLLAGCPPFWNRKEHLMLRQIMEGRYSFPSPEWDDISETAKDLIRRLLVVDTNNRIKSEEALKHDFFVQQTLTVPSGFDARHKFRVGIMAVRFIHCLRDLRTRGGYLHIKQLAVDPYANRKLRKIIDTLSYDVYSQWVKKGEDQNRAAMFENVPRRDLIEPVSKDEEEDDEFLGAFCRSDTVEYGTFDYDDEECLRAPIRVEY
ncbi:Phosphorylase b kinase gamma catalytic chain, skeletal muscle/heart isoform [Clonorchis sinensis]|uniref:phosphorylase kinase n=1 Tax=Clonorchis sinensis TaxID=79923 RepID=A0A3R7D6H9_CLOSI|nr:Phosphorylase b kinase gamma catalytic chain, skeletal muscle/heart isoform [Clonorchis sinensis]